LSEILNYVLARYFIHSETGTVEFNKELARMTFWSYPVIVLPCTIILMTTLMGLIKRLAKLTHLSWEEMLVGMHTNFNCENLFLHGTVCFQWIRNVTNESYIVVDSPA
jgi:hypothetical protein